MVKVLKTFIDKNTKSLYTPNSNYETHDVNRVIELQENGFLEGSVQSESSDVVEGLKSLPGGFYELPNGEKVRGKAKAIEALEALSNGDDGNTEGGDGNGAKSGDGTDGGTGEPGDGQESSEGGSE